MKRILFVALAATLLAAGCQKTEIINHVPGDAMTFSTGMSKLTKAVGDAENDGMVNLQTQNFKVWAYCAYADAINTVTYGDIYDKMSALDVTYNESAWTTVLDYYWPGTAKKLDFFAVSTSAAWKTAEAAGVECEITNGGAETIGEGARTLKVKTYTVDNANPNDDLMVSEFVRQDQSMNDKKVKLHFKHALAKVQFKFLTNAAATDVVNVKSLVVEDLKTTGNLTVTETAETYGANDQTGRVKVTLAWDPAETLADFSDDHDGDLLLTAEAVEYATWLVLPQDITGKTVKIVYTINDRQFDQIFALTRAAQAEVKDGETVVTPAKDAFNAWGTNQVIIYTINLSPNKITFDPSVEGWEADTPLTDVN